MVGILINGSMMRKIVQQFYKINGRNGQAAIELALGVLIIIFLFVCGLFYIQVAGVQRQMVTTLRGEVGAAALSSSSALDLPNYIVTWNDGVDEIPYTADDRPINNPQSTTLIGIANRSVRDSSDWDIIRDLPNPTPIYGLHDTPLTMSELRLIKGEMKETVTADESVDPQGWFGWLYGRDHVRVKHTVWMPVISAAIDAADPTSGGFL